MEPHHFFAPCPRGLESILATELEKLGAFSVQIHDGGVKFQGNWYICYRTNLESRIASRILWQITKQPYIDEADIYKISHAFPWNEWFSPTLTIRVNVAAIKCPLRSLDFVTLRIKDAICDKFRELTNKRPSVNTVNPDIRIHGFLDAQEFTLYLDTSGDALFKRNLRKTIGEAPLRENLAAGILQLAGWEPGIPLLDPMCGSGTFLLEAVQMSLNISPGIRRSFAFEKFKKFDEALWSKLKRESVARQKTKIHQPIYGSDLYGDALADAHTNLSMAGFSDVVALKQGNILEISAPASTGILVANPPYGKRVGDQEELAEFYPKLGDALKKRFIGWNAYLFTGDTLLPKLIRLAASRRIPLFNAAIECRLLEYKIVGGGMRKIKKDGVAQRSDSTSTTSQNL
ncbi:MAG: class I SAM-dependent RNA methyltransferase [Nitrosomonadales bacterium]|nr:MAG: class I SAM-dependent RNA methyltransferase [Nitrosomonadales bacterium]